MKVFDVCHKFEIGIKHDDTLDGRIQSLMQNSGEEEKRLLVISVTT